MSERGGGHHRGGGRGGGGGGHHSHHQHRGGRGGGGGGRGGGGGGGTGLAARGHGHHGPGGGGPGGGGPPRREKENILDLARYMNKQLMVKFGGGREVTGILKGHDPLLNLVLDEVKERVRDDSGNESTRPLGLVVIRGTHIMLLGPADGSLRIANPFLPSSDEDSGNYDADDDE